MHRFIIILVLFMVLGCNADKKSSKKYLLTKDQMVAVLVDIHLAFAIQMIPEYHDLLKLYDSINVHSGIFIKHHIDKAAFDSTFSYYSRNPENLIDIYDEVIMRLSKMQDSIKVDE